MRFNQILSCENFEGHVEGHHGDDDHSEGCQSVCGEIIHYLPTEFISKKIFQLQKEFGFNLRLELFRDEDFDFCFLLFPFILDGLSSGNVDNKL